MLTTKLNIPPTRHELVARTHLYERLSECFNYNLVLVSAPAGFGKTTLLSEWIRSTKPPINAAWISLDESDNDPVRFWDYIITALQKIQPDCGEKILPLLHSTPQPTIETVLTALINDLSTITGDYVVVLDDYHLIETQAIHDGITYLLKYMPAKMHLLLATRADPPLPLAYLRGRGKLMEIGTDELRFNLEDTASLLKELRVPELAAGDVVALNERTEGWAVGLKMAALSMSGQKNIPGFIAAFTGSHRYVMDYLMEEVLQKQTHELREFLCKTSILKRLSAPLCDAITEREGSRAVLLELERGHLFVIPLDEERQWYRYEHLFSDLLQHQCQITYGTEQAADLHKKASQWYEDNNYPDDAIHHSLASKDWETAMRLIYDRCEESRKRVEYSTILAWLRVIPDELLRTHHRLYSQYAALLVVAGQIDDAEAALNYLEKETLDNANLQGEVAFSLASIARLRGDIRRTVELAEKALSVLPPDNITMRCRATFIIGLVQSTGGFFYNDEKWFVDTYEMAKQVGDYWMASTVLNMHGAMLHQCGRLYDAAEMFKRAIEAANQTQAAAAPQCKLCRVQYEWNDLTSAAENARLSAEWYELGGYAEAQVVTYFFQAQIYLAWGNVSGALAAIERMDKASSHPTVSRFYQARQAVGHVVLAIRQNDAEAEAIWGKRLSKYTDILHHEFQYVLPRLLITQGRKKEAREYLKDLYERLVQLKAYGLVIGVRICQALAADNEESALEFLTDALIKGKPESFIRSFVDEGTLIIPLLEKALSQGITPEYTRKLIDIIKAEERQKRKMQKVEGVPSKYGSILSQREIEVIKLIAEGLSNQQIADMLVISLGTVKNHVHNIIEKLEAKGRTQAVAQARELKLI